MDTAERPPLVRDRTRRRVAEKDHLIASGTGHCTEFTVTRMEDPTVGGYFNSVGPQRQEVFLGPGRDCAEVRAWRVTRVRTQHTIRTDIHIATRTFHMTLFLLLEGKPLITRTPDLYFSRALISRHLAMMLMPPTQPV